MKPKFIIIWYDLQACRDFTWRVSDCEEIVGVTNRRMMGLVLGGFYLKGSEYGFYC